MAYGNSALFDFYFWNPLLQFLLDFSSLGKLSRSTRILRADLSVYLFLLINCAHYDCNFRGFYKVRFQPRLIWLSSVWSKSPQYYRLIVFHAYMCLLLFILLPNILTHDSCFLLETRLISFDHVVIFVQFLVASFGFCKTNLKWINSNP